MIHPTPRSTDTSLRCSFPSECFSRVRFPSALDLQSSAPRHIPRESPTLRSYGPLSSDPTPSAACRHRQQPVESFIFQPTPPAACQHLQQPVQAFSNQSTPSTASGHLQHPLGTFANQSTHSTATPQGSGPAPVGVVLPLGASLCAQRTRSHAPLHSPSSYPTWTAN